VTSSSANKRENNSVRTKRIEGEKLPDKKSVVTLRTVADRVGLAPCSVSAVLNRTPASSGIPQRTKDRVFRAAALLNYRPNLSARSLRTKRTHMVAVVSMDLGRPPVSRLIAGMERLLRRRGYLLVLGSLDSASQWTNMTVDLQQRGVEGVIAVATNPPRELDMPMVSVDLGFVPLQESLASDMSVWFAELAESAVEALLVKIENKAVPRSSKIVPRLPHPYFNLPGVSLGSHGEVAAAAD